MRSEGTSHSMVVNAVRRAIIGLSLFLERRGEGAPMDAEKRAPMIANLNEAVKEEEGFSY